MIIPQAHVQFNGVHWYCLQPGDGTAYQFGFLDFANAFMDGAVTPTITDKDQSIRGNYPRIKAGPSSPAYVSDVFTGISQNGEDYILVIVDMSSGQGCYPVLRSSLRDVDRFIVGYYKGHTGGQLYTNSICAILLAVSVLMDRPFATVEAARRMLDWVDVMAPKESNDG